VLHHMLAKEQPRCIYEVLGVSATADAVEIRKSFRRRALVAHPDKGGSSAEFREIVNAFRILSNPNTRRDYDRKHRARTRWPKDTSDPFAPSQPRRNPRKRDRATTFAESAAPRHARNASQRHQAESPGPGEKPAEKIRRAAESVTVPTAPAPGDDEASGDGEEAQGPQDTSPVHCSRNDDVKSAGLMLRALDRLVRTAPRKERRGLVQSFSHKVRAELVKYLESSPRSTEASAWKAAERVDKTPGVSEAQGDNSAEDDAAVNPGGMPAAEEADSPSETADMAAEARRRRCRIDKIVRLLEASLNPKATSMPRKPCHAAGEGPCEAPPRRRTFDPFVRQARLAWWRRRDLTTSDLLAGCPI